MKRTVLAVAGLALAGAAVPALRLPAARASSVFNTQPLDQSRFVVLARPVGTSDWNLLVLEQIQPQPVCWQGRPDGLIDPALNRFDFTGICSRYLDSNGYSLRAADQDLATSHRLRVFQRGNQLELQATSATDATVLVVGRGSVPLRDRDGFVSLQLDPGWELKRRAYGQQAIGHVYFAHDSALPQLIASAGGRPFPAMPPLAPPPPLAVGPAVQTISLRTPAAVPLATTRTTVAPPTGTTSSAGRPRHLAGMGRSGRSTPTPAAAPVSRIAAATSQVSASSSAMAPSPEDSAPTSLRARTSLRSGSAGQQLEEATLLPGRAVALQVIPYNE